MVKKCDKVLLSCFILCISFFGTTLSLAEAAGKRGDNEVLGIGTSAIIKGNVARAKGSAISQALIKGVENYLLRRLGSEGVVNNFQRFIQEVVPRAQEHIENFYILAEEQIGDKYNVIVRITINEKLVDERLREAGLVLMEGPPIKVLFMVSETREGAVSFWWADQEVFSTLSPTELALHRVFQERGFSPINRGLSAPETEYSKDLRSSDLQEAIILRWGELFSADVVIYGQADIIHEKEISLALMALDVNQGVQICQGTRIEPIEKGLGGQEAITETLERLASHMAASLAPSIVGFIAADRKKTYHVEITLRGLSAYRQLRVFKDFLRRDVSAVTSVRQTRIKKNEVSLSIEFQGDRERLLGRVMNHENLPFSLNLEQTEEGEIIFTIQ